MFLITREFCLDNKSFSTWNDEKKARKNHCDCIVWSENYNTNGAVYCASKYGVDGLMETLFDDLCIENLEESIRTTTVYPYFINTNKKIADVMEEIDDMLPRYAPKYVAEEAVKGILINKRKIYVIPSRIFLIIQ